MAARTPEERVNAMYEKSLKKVEREIKAKNRLLSHDGCGFEEAFDIILTCLKSHQFIDLLNDEVTKRQHGFDCEQYRKELSDDIAEAFQTVYRAACPMAMALREGKPSEQMIRNLEDACESTLWLSCPDTDYAEMVLLEAKENA